MATRGARATSGAVDQPSLGNGAAGRVSLAERARALGIEPLILSPDRDLAELAASAVERGADVLGMAGGDGSLAIVAATALAHGLPFVCVPAGTRNHFALDVGVVRHDVIGALAAFTDGLERRIDVAQVNGRLFLNNVSLGIYGESRGRCRVEQSLRTRPRQRDAPAA
jgi:diacylglycerol kinase family enzyme